MLFQPFLVYLLAICTELVAKSSITVCVVLNCPDLTGTDTDREISAVACFMLKLAVVPVRERLLFLRAKHAGGY